MQYTTHFNLNLPEGTDIVNPLVQDNPNYSAIDAAMFANKQAVIGTATEVVSGTVHAITRSNPDSDYFKFTATGNWSAGDSMSVDGTAVSVYLSDGTSPATGAYIINTEVLALLSGTRVTLIISNGVVASEIGTLSNLTTSNKSNLVNAINEVNDKYAADNLQTRIAIDNYNSANNLYTFPYDGYIELLPSDNTKTGFIFVFGSQSDIIDRSVALESQGQYVSLYVRKGMRCYGGGTASRYYIPIN